VRRWHENGQLAAHEEYENGKWQGRRAAWHENGQVQVDWRYENGKLCEGLEVLPRERRALDLVQDGHRGEVP
jgi:antitoxin component YwqK of YwqJK toxin-antitoxin module